MTSKPTVVTPERFQKGLTFQQFVTQAKVNKGEFEQFYRDFQPKPEDAAFFKKAAASPGGPARVLALGEDWCPDVYRGLPVMARIAEAAGMELRIFPRDQNLDIMDQFLNQGQFRSIPTFVFYTKVLHYLCHWSERPALANKERAEIEAQVKREMPSADEQAVRAEVRQRTRVRYPSWQQATAQELRELLGCHVR